MRHLARRQPANRGADKNTRIILLGPRELNRFSLYSIFHPCTRVVKFDKRYYSYVSNVRSKFVKEVVNKTRSENENEN